MINKYYIVIKYAEALIEAAVESNQLDAVAEDLEVISGIMDEEFTKMLHIANISNVASDKIRNSSFLKKCNPLIQNFFSVLAENGRIVLIKDIIEAFFEQKFTYEKAEKVLVESAQNLNEEEKNTIRTLISDIFDGKIHFKFYVDKSLIYGIRIIHKSKVLDLSLQGMINNLKINEVIQ